MLIFRFMFIFQWFCHFYAPQLYQRYCCSAY